MTSYVVERFIHWKLLTHPGTFFRGPRPGDPSAAYVSAGLPAPAQVFVKPRAEPRLMRITIAGGGEGRLVEETDGPDRPWRPADGPLEVQTQGPNGRGRYFAVWTLGGTPETTRAYAARVAWNRLNAAELANDMLFDGRSLDTTVTMNDFAHRWMICHYLDTWVPH